MQNQVQEPGRSTILKADRLVKTYRSVRAVSDVSFSICSGDILGYLGPNGSGKSTTVNMLAGLLDPTSGQIFYRGVTTNSNLLAYKANLGYVSEEGAALHFSDRLGISGAGRNIA
jgi:ABC-2 type transport system ATP-binding protein